MMFHLNRKGRGALRFELGGIDKTAAEMKLTQEAIDEAFSTDLLTRAVFFGQTEVNALLEVSLCWSMRYQCLELEASLLRRPAWRMRWFPPDESKRPAEGG